MLEVGIKGLEQQAVSAENTALAMGSGTLEVFATPALVALAEKTCWQSVAPHLEEGCSTVGTRMELDHSAPTPLGMTVICESGRPSPGVPGAYAGRDRPCGMRRPPAVHHPERKVHEKGAGQKAGSVLLIFVPRRQMQRRRPVLQQLLLGTGLGIL